MEKSKKKSVQDEILRWFCWGTLALLFAAAFLFAPPGEIFRGMVEIIRARDALITDYFELAGYGAGFFNAALMMLLSILMIELVKLPYTGLTLAALFISTCFGFWGKNPTNSLPIIFGVWLYSRLHGMTFARNVYTALFATCLAPFVTELIYILPFPFWVNLTASLLMGLFIGFIIPPLSAHTASIHMGYSLFNVGFSGGTLAFVMFCILKSHGIESESVFIWKAERHPAIVAGLFLYFALVFLLGLWLERGRFGSLLELSRHPGRAVTDYVMMEGPGATLMNMGLMGIVAEIHVLLVGGEMSGPILGCLLTVFGFSAFGAHLKNYLPVAAGVYLSTFFTKYEVDSPSILIAALFCVGLSPVAGQFGPVAGMAAGALHSAIVMCTGQMYGGLNLYNNGFSAGWVAIVMLPVIEGFMTHFGTGRKKRENAAEEKKS